MNYSYFLKPKLALRYSTIAVVLLGLIDYATGWEFGFFVFYFIPIAYGSWCGGFKASLFVTLLSGITWLFADVLLGHTYSSHFFLFWNTIIRLISFVTVSFFVRKITFLLTKEKKISHDLREALNQIKTLRGFLPICAWCKKIRNDNGYWEQLEHYISDHSEAKFTHGLCSECAKKMELEITDNSNVKS